MVEPPTTRKLTPEQQAKAMALYRDLMALREEGIKLALLHIEDDLGLRAVGQRRRVSGAIDSNPQLA